MLNEELFDCLFTNPEFLFNKNKDDIDYIKMHLLRYKISMCYIKILLENCNTLLELGNKNYFCEIIKNIFPHIHIDYVEEDLRYDFLLNIENKYDVILCMETIEHIKDREIYNDIKNIKTFHLESFVGDGILSMLNNCNRLLKPHGKLFLTTPNLNGYRNIRQLIKYEHPFGYEPHPRELTKKNVIGFLQKTNYEIDKCDFFDCWPFISIEEQQLIDKLCSVYTTVNERQDDMFFIASKR